MGQAKEKEISAGRGREPEGVSRSIHISRAAEEVTGVVGRLMYLVDTNVWLELLLEQQSYQFMSIGVTTLSPRGQSWVGQSDYK